MIPTINNNSKNSSNIDSFVPVKPMRKNNHSYLDSELLNTNNDKIQETDTVSDNNENVDNVKIDTGSPTRNIVSKILNIFS